ncbi:hypothetical protein [Urbifossiella limnaea]|uniref:DUF4476 domain-containing protein n=1 Tax=Urbifossiella limnaea TaxID=2528023 RepID=A0A517XLL0_9BACT|nr:hypothetical protein [Urbifossiella limnaea]QDU18397.1 hypothetical protein ETAA1_02830 [Urbifossiella limnaea]
MTRWIGKRGLWGVVAAGAVAGGAFATEPGDVVTFKEGNKDRKVTVTKVNKKADGSVEVTGKDASGEVTSWVEGPAAAAAKAATPGKATAPAAPVTPPALPKAKARAEDPMGAPTAPMPETAAERERRLFNGKFFGRDTPAPTPAAAAGTTAPQIAEAGEPKAKPGLLNRIFGKKSAPVPAAMPGPAVTTPTAAAPAAKAAPTAVEPKVAAPVRPAPAAAPPVKAAAPVPTPSIPVPMPLPATRPAPVAVPVPQPLPPVVPLPTIPGVPQSARPGEPVHVVLPVGYVPPEVAMADDVRPFAGTLRDGGSAVRDRLLAAKGLADGRHGSTDQVKAMLFAAAQRDPAATVRAACVDHLVRLGYYHPDFMSHLNRLAEGAAGEERDAARAGLAKMTPRRW